MRIWSKTATIPAVNTGKSWLTYTFRSPDGTIANIGQKLVRGVIPDIVTDGLGRRVRPSDPDALAATLAEALAVPSDRWRSWSHHARDTYLERYTPDANYRRLMEIYGLALDTSTAP